MSVPAYASDAEERQKPIALARADRCSLAYAHGQSGGASAECRQSCRFGRSAAERPDIKAHCAASKWRPRLESNQRHQV